VAWIAGTVADAVEWLKSMGIEMSSILTLLAILGVIVAAAAIVSRSGVSRNSESGAGRGDGQM
jgi:hypothetical protein